MSATGSHDSSTVAVDDAAAAGSSRVYGSRYQADALLKRSRGIETLAGVDLETRHRVVIKTTVDGQIPGSVRLRLEHEARILSEIRHPHLVPMLSFGSLDEQFHLVMPYVTGQTLEERLGESTLSVAETIHVGECLLEALKAAHDHGVLHRDIKPANIIVSGDDPLSATLIDFGLARSSQLTATLRDQSVGTAKYMSPEQSGLLDQPVDEPSDLYSLGIVLFECLAGKTPFEADSMSEMLRQHAAVKPPELRSLGVPLPRAMDEIIQRLLRKDPRDRYQTAEAVLADLRMLRSALERGDAETSVVVGRYDRRGTLTEPAFVGRHEEIAELERHLQTRPSDAVEHAATGTLVYVEAESGGGKTRLLTELEQRLTRSGVLVLRGYGLDLVVQKPFQVLAGVVEGLVAQARRNPAWKTTLCDRLAGYEDAIAAALPELAAVLDWQTHGASGPEAFGEVRTLQSLAGLLDALGDERRRCVVILDDCQWADGLAIRLIRQWQRGNSDGGPASCVSLVAAFRSEEVSESHALRELQPELHQRLAAFVAEDVRKLVESMAGPLPDAAVSAIEKFSNGSPFMASAVLRGMVECGALVSGTRGWTIDPDELASVQSSHHAGMFLSRRIELLPGPTLELLTIAAVLGKEFDLETLALVAESSPATAIVNLTEARRRHLVWQQGDGTDFAFVHDQVRETLLRRLEDGDRRRLHERAAGCIEQTCPDRVFELACHFDAAGQPEKALPFALKAAEQARRRHSLEIALELYRIAERAQTPDAALQCEITERLGDLLMLSGQYPAAIEQFEQASELVRGQSRSDPVTSARIVGKLGEVAFKQGDMRTAVVRLRRALGILGEHIPQHPVTRGLGLLKEIGVQTVHSLFPGRIRRRTRQATDIDRTIIRLYNRLAYAEWFVHGMTHCLHIHLRELNRAERYAPTLELAQACSTHAPGMSLLPWFSRSMAYARRSYDIRCELKDVWGQGQSLNFHGVVLYAASRFDECIDKCREAIRLLERTGDYWEVNMARYQLAASLYRQGRLSEAVTEARRLHESGVELGDAQASGISLDIWARATVGQVPREIVTQEIERSRFDAQGSAQTWLAAGVCALLGDRDPQKAVETLERARREAEDAGVQNAWVAAVYPWLATALRKSAEEVSPWLPAERRRLLSHAAMILEKGHRLARRFQNDLPHVLREKGLQAALASRPLAARNWLRHSMDVARRQGAELEVALTMRAYGRVGLACGWPDAQTQLDTADRRLTELGMSPLVTDTHQPVESVTLSLADRFDTVLEAGREIASSLARADITAAARNAAMRLLRAEDCQFLEVTHKGGQIDVQPGSGSTDAIVRTETVQAAVSARKAIATVEEVSESISESVLLPGQRSVLCVPILVRGNVEACLYATHRQIAGFFGDDEERLGEFIAAIAGAALENADGFLQLERLNDELFANKMTLEMRVQERTSELASRHSELEAQRQELARSNAELQQFAYVTSHDLQEPLRTVGAYCQLLEKKYGDQLDDRARDFICRAVSGVERMTLLIRDLLDYSRVHTRKREPARIDCNQLIERVKNSLGASMRQHEATITHDELPCVYGDAAQLERVFQNLIGNAIKFKAPDRLPHVHVSASQSGGFQTIAIKDNGIGINSEHFERIFHIFQRLHKRDAYEGTGIGLAIVKKTVELHGGVIDVESEVGQGTTFYIRLPVARLDAPIHRGLAQDTVAMHEEPAPGSSSDT